MEYRDQENQGHSRRVTDHCLALAHFLGVTQEQLGHIRRGALRHDIGKLTLLDSILLKNGSLDEAEWALVKRHPQFAKEMLEKSPFYPQRWTSLIPIMNTGMDPDILKA